MIPQKHISRHLSKNVRWRVVDTKTIFIIRSVIAKVIFKVGSTDLVRYKGKWQQPMSIFYFWYRAKAPSTSANHGFLYSMGGGVGGVGTSVLK